MGIGLRWAIQPTIKPESPHISCTYYVTKWVEAVALSRATEESIIKFLFELFVRYGLLREVITDGGAQFTGNKITSALRNHHIIHIVTSPYHPQANGQVESTNKVLEAILTKIVVAHRRDWATKLPEALWAIKQPSEIPLYIHHISKYLGENLSSLSSSKLKH